MPFKIYVTVEACASGVVFFRYPCQAAPAGRECLSAVCNVGPPSTAKLSNTGTNLGHGSGVRSNAVHFNDGIGWDAKSLGCRADRCSIRRLI